MRIIRMMEIWSAPPVFANAEIIRKSGKPKAHLADGINFNSFRKGAEARRGLSRKSSGGPHVLGIKRQFDRYPAAVVDAHTLRDAGNSGSVELEIAQRVAFDKNLGNLRF